MARADELTGGRGRFKPYSPPVLAGLAVVSPLVRAVLGSRYQFDAPFASESRVTEEALGVRATGWDESLPPTVRSVRAHAA